VVIFLQISAADAEKRYAAHRNAARALLSAARLHSAFRVVCAACSGGYGGERYERKDVQERVARVFAELRSGTAPSASSATAWVMLDGARSADAVAADIWAVAERVVREAADKPLAVLPCA
jgi:hypothetical protein